MRYTQNSAEGIVERMGTIALFDMDGVLLTPGGYHRALQDTVAFLGHCLGFPDANLTQAQIHAFEAAGITNEWDAAAVCLGVLADARWEVQPELPLGPGLLADPLPPDGASAPDFSRVIGRIAEETSRGNDPIQRAQSVLPARVHGFVAEAYSMDGLSQRVQQEHVLGSEEFRRVYGLAPRFDVESYLLVHDRSNLAAGDLARLRRWRSGGGRPAIFTNRPTAAPDGVHSTPEGELGARLVDLEDVPLAGSGGIVWLEARFGRPAGTYNKPRPAHALAALQMALGAGQEYAYLEAHRLVGGGERSRSWDALAGSEVWVFEDSTAGIESLRIAKDLLRQEGIFIQVVPVGVSDSAAKVEALEKAGARVFPTLAEALRRFFESQGL